MVKKIKKIQYTPPIAIHPGETLLETIEERNITQAQLAQRMGRPLKAINEIIKGKASITPETAMQLERVLGISARFWNNLEVNFQETKVRLKGQSKLRSEIREAEKYPYDQMQKWGWIPRVEEAILRVKHLLVFFGVNSLENIIEEKSIEPMSYRISKKRKYSWPAIIAWLRKGVIDAETIATEEFNSDKLKKSLDIIRRLTWESPDIFVSRLKKTLSENGVAFVITPNLKNAPVNGASRWVSPSKALIQLSIRHKYADIFWFTLFHEIAHILFHSKKITNINLDKTKEKKEKEADRFAANTLIPKQEYEIFVKKNDFSRDAIDKFSKKIDIHPGIVGGRLQYDKYISHRFNTQRIRLAWVKK